MSNYATVEYFKGHYRTYSYYHLQEIINTVGANPHAITAAQELLNEKQSEEKSMNPFKVGDQVVHTLFGPGVLMQVGKLGARMVNDQGEGWDVSYQLLTLADNRETDQEEQDAENIPEAPGILTLGTAGIEGFTSPIHLMHPSYAFCPHQWETHMLFTSHYQKCKLCGEEQ